MSQTPEEYIPFQELFDAKKRRLFELLRIDLPPVIITSSTLAGLWLSDLEAMENLVRRVRERDKLIPALLVHACDRDTMHHGLSQIPAPLDSAARCWQRDGGRCVISKSSEPIAPMSIFPALPEAQRSVFWQSLPLFWSRQKVSDWQNATLQADSCHKYLTLDHRISTLWTRARFGIKPIAVSLDRKTLEAQFFWLPPGQYMHQTNLAGALNHELHQTPGPVIDSLTGQHLKSGDSIFFQTGDPTTHPLPSFELLEMRWEFGRVAALSGVEWQAQ
ncbi:hypothetical protein BDV18DRAFT_159696 [Aspergillus unguis]